MNITTMMNWFINTMGFILPKIEKIIPALFICSSITGFYLLFICKKLNGGLKNETKKN